MQLRRRHFALFVNLFWLLSTAGNASPLSYAALYDDAACSSTPTKFTFTEDSNCVSQATPTCSAVLESSIYSAQACLTTSDYNEVLRSAFPSSLYLVVETFSDAGKCSVLKEVVAYLADNVCHVAEDGASSFKVSTAFDTAATLETFSNVDCSHSNADQIVYMGGATSKLSITTFFTDSECSKPINLQVYRRFVCEAEQNPASAACSFVDEDLYSTWSYADDYVTFTASTFGSGVPFLVEEWYYDQDTCKELEHLMIYPADGSCVALGWPSFTVNLQAGGSATFETFGSSGCSGSSETRTLDRVSLAAKACDTDSNIKYHVGGVTPQWKVIAVHEGADCSNIAVKLTFTSEFTCEPLTSDKNDGCTTISTRASSINDCTEDYLDFSRAAFGENHPYAVVEEYIGEGDCTVLEVVTVYVADGLCHNSSDDLASFSVEVLEDLSATITTYELPGCDSSGKIISVADSFLDSHSCFEGEKKFYLCGLTTQWTAGVVYDSSDCTKTPVQIAFTKEPTCTPSSSSHCIQTGSSGNFLSHDCASDYLDFAVDVFDGSPYLIVGTYKAESDCSVVENIVAYLADEESH
ncbi:hypothetical protein PF005_g879 [Phytophthora fragariae]|uniref:Membrane-associated protein n=1 Tax=Phytophthora fragariae TaxID=53985 RepID=A0A6A3TRE5_9STRA|nr:hypothetical protein PF003_g20471 [Phytophthora fragariae]KAE8949899.1 hypothetical protein PF009_g573 [Phytophthora fragariae]KAE9030716.1 hypothetical protein PF011_g489 [Phytophthora fragariae]KAE9140709.1 hypothetical protein PF007_g572 [Phytophthora fragariae]KAE9155287.1 hypothetical protein PF006_g767 [Phytophthora fragariae]